MKETDISNEDLLDMVNAKISLAQTLIERLQKFLQVDGAVKIQRKIGQELKFLEKIKKTGQIKLHHLLCSNLVHFEYLIDTLHQCKNIKNIDFPIALPDRKSPLRVDIVCDNGCTWIKVVARNPKSLSDSANGRSGYGTKTILDQAMEFIQSADSNKCIFKAPTVIFEFAHEIDGELASELQEIGVVVSSSIRSKNNIENRSEQEVSIIDPDLSNFEAVCRVDKLNLDVTTLLAYVSAMTNGSSNWEYAEAILTEQACCERKNPVKAILDRVFEGKQLICCKTAAASFAEICDLLGGANEKIRGKEFMKRVEIMPDTEIPCELEKLNVGGKIKERSLIIFSFGIAKQALTITANEGFVRSARMKGIDIPVFIHGARPLSEQKENRAKAIVL